MIHKLADVQSTKIGTGTRIWQFCVVLPEARIGSNCNINANVLIENDVLLGDNVTVKSGVQLWDGVRVEDDVFIGPNATFANDASPRSKRYPERFLQTRLLRGASIGANATVIGGITVGRYAMIGAGSLLNKDVGDYELWYGSPAAFQGYVCECGTRLDERLYCKACKKVQKGIQR